MSVMCCITGLESMSLGGSGASHMTSGHVTTLDDGHCITERTPAADSIQKIGGIDGLRVTMHKLGVLISGSRCGRVDGSRRRVASVSIEWLPPSLAHGAKKGPNQLAAHT